MQQYSSWTPIARSKSEFIFNYESQTVVIGLDDKWDLNELLNQFSLIDESMDKGLNLEFERIKSRDELPITKIYLNVEDKKSINDQNYVGSLSMYGLIENSERNGKGLSFIYEVGSVFKKVRRQTNWSNKEFWLTFVPFGELSKEASLSIGRIVLYFKGS